MNEETTGPAAARAGAPVVEPRHPSATDDAESPAESGDAAASTVLDALRAAPPLTTLAAVAGVAELVASRWLWLTLGSRPGADATMMALRRQGWLDLPRTLAALAAMVGLAFGLASFLRLPGYAPMGRRLSVAAFSGILLPAFLVAIFLPRAFTQERLVLLALAATHVLVTLVAITAARYRAGGPFRIATSLAALAGFLTLVTVGLRRLAEAPARGLWAPVTGLLQAYSVATLGLLSVLQSVGEGAWLGVLLAGGVAAAGGATGTGRWRRLGLAVSLAAVLSLLGLRAADLLGPSFGLFLYGSFRLQALFSSFPALYVIPLAFGLASALIAMVRSDPGRRQAGLGVLLWLLAGYGPHTPYQMIYLLLGALLLSRSAQALDPNGEWQHRRPWQRPAGAASSG
ncbi:MAG: hypothetical protein ACFCGT_18285 [Sandaracinaceae bacterium]